MQILKIRIKVHRNTNRFIPSYISHSSTCKLQHSQVCVQSFTHVKNNLFVKDIDDKVKDVRSLLINDQRIPKLEVS